MIIRNIWICGIGGVGGYFGGRMAHKISQLSDHNYNIYFLARGSHLEEIKKKGLMLRTSDGEELTCRPTLASADIKDFPTPDLCLVCVKSYDLEDLIVNIKKKVTNDSIIIALMNGFDIYDRIRKNLKKGIVLPSCVYVGSHIEKPGLVIQSGNPGFFYSGFDPLLSNFNPKPLIDFFNEMGIKMRWKDDPNPIIWQKYLLVASFALVAVHTRQTLGEIIFNNDSHEILKKVMEEIVMIAERKGVVLPNNIIEDTIEFCKDYPDVKPSYLRDVEKGKRNEGALFGGAILKMGKKLGIPTEMTATIYKD